MAKGKFVTIEGCEGVGKSTQTRFLKEYCISNNIDAFFTREPGGTDIAEQIRRIILDANNTALDPIAELMLYCSCRAQHTAELIKAKLDEGKIVFCDRYIDSTMAYQGYGRGLDVEMIGALNKWAERGVKIDLTIFIDLNPTQGFLRKGGVDKGDRLEQAGKEFHEKVYEGFCAIADKEPDRIKKVDASGTKFQTQDKIIELLKKEGIF